VLQSGADAGLNLWLWWPSLRGGWSPEVIATKWTVLDTIEAVKALVFQDYVDWASSPKPKPAKR